MTDDFFTRPILSSPYEYPARCWELDSSGQPTQKVMETRRLAEFVAPIPKPKKRRAAQIELALDEGHGLSTDKQRYAQTSLINDLRAQVDKWRIVPNPGDWQVSPETARLASALAVGWVYRGAAVFLPDRGGGDGDLA